MDNRECGNCGEQVLTDLSDTYSCGRDCSAHWPDGAIYCRLACCEEAHRIATCVYCNEPVTDAEEIPALDDDTAWSRIAAEHYVGCEWIHTRAHRREA